MKNNKLKIKEKAKLKIEGSMSIYEMNDLRTRFVSFIEENDFLELDIKDVFECDTSGIQLLCSALRSAREKGKKINIVGKSQAVEDALSRAGMTLHMITY